ncbi:hypothetical protein [Nonomuraea pusilla]|uniref:Uncharacterized protein n=1 Tax=Nonomuraea pusilla TaxID=46177 RepID=A0A1H8K9C5_9ACTN|nr:hypothetical protein [Nonomuraea pusilla]SEN89563.1 hypothetical protein SAMN05660976_08554 [Nonomuraea pusilla]
MAKGSADHVRRYYQVPAKRGARIKFRGQDGTIVGFQGAGLRVRLDDDPKRIHSCHPTWRIDYLDGRGER